MIMNFIEACTIGDLNIAQWLLSINPKSLSVESLMAACASSQIHIVNWIVTYYAPWCITSNNFYNYIVRKYIKFKDISPEIKNILISNDLIDLSIFDLDDLQDYLAITNNVVPKGFKNKYNLTVSERGTRTKPAPHN